MSTLIIPKAVRTQYVDADGIKVFYREAGKPGAPVILLIHGYPSSSHQFRHLIPLLAKEYRVIAPDMPGFGFTQIPEGRCYQYTFDGLAKTLERFVDVLGLGQYALYFFDYGAPTSLRLAIKHPERVTALISQNGNAYLEGLGSAWEPIKEYWANPSSINRQIIHDHILNLEATKWQYLHGVPDPDCVAPESYLLDDLLMQRPGNKDIQLDLFLDYANNLTLYPDFQQFFRAFKGPALVIWGRHDPFFIPPGARAFARDITHADIELLDTGHFALETHVDYIAQRILQVLTPQPASNPELNAR